MAPNLLALGTTLENLGARRLLAKKVNFVPCIGGYQFCMGLKRAFESLISEGYGSFILTVGV